MTILGRWPRIAAAWTMIFAIAGCGSGTPVQTEIPRAHNNLRNLTFAYAMATTALDHPPSNAEELAPFLTKFGDPKELLRSPIDGAELVVAWGVDFTHLKSKNGQQPIWAHEKNSHNGKRWVLQERQPVELTEEEFKNSLFAPGLK